MSKSRKEFLPTTHILFSRSLYIIFLLFYSGSGVFKCSRCSIAFRDSDRSVMEKHCVSVHAAAAVVYRCPACVSSFPR